MQKRKMNNFLIPFLPKKVLFLFCFNKRIKIYCPHRPILNPPSTLYPQIFGNKDFKVLNYFFIVYNYWSWFVDAKNLLYIYISWWANNVVQILLKKHLKMKPKRAVAWPIYAGGTSLCLNKNVKVGGGHRGWIQIYYSHGQNKTIFSWGGHVLRVHYQPKGMTWLDFKYCNLYKTLFYLRLVQTCNKRMISAEILPCCS